MSRSADLSQTHRIVLIAICFVLVGCNRPTLPPKSSECSNPVSDSQQPYSSYLPLTTGNTWVYRKTVNQEVFAWEAYGATNKDTVTLAMGTPPNILLGKSEETYTVKGRSDGFGLELWEIAVSDPRARDGRYGSWYTKPDKILWGRVPSSEHLIEIDEILIQESFFEGEKRHQGILLAEPLAEGMEVTLQSLESVRYTVSPNLEAVNVPAGTFPCTLVVATLVQNNTQNAGSWTTYSYYAPNVGLVKEVQQDSSGNTTYALELVKYILQ